MTQIVKKAFFNARAKMPLWFLIILVVTTMLRFDRPLIRGDGVAYLAWVDTFALDQDINFDNQLERLGHVNSYQITWNEETQRFVNIFPFGVAILQAPFYLVGHFFLNQGWGNINPDYFRQMQGVELPYSFGLMIGANLMTLASTILVWSIGKRITDEWSAAIAAWAFFLGTPLFYYTTVSPLNSHNPGAFMVTCFIYLLVLCTEAFNNNSEVTHKHKLFYWVLLGFFGGMMVLVRWQLLLILIAGLGLLAWHRQWRAILYAGATAAVTMLPLPLIWQYMFNRPFVVPYESVSGQQFLHLPLQSWWILLETPHNSPILFLSLIGIFFLWKLNRPWTIFVCIVIGLQIVINGTVLDWWGGETYGIRRMTELYPLYVLLACAALGRVSTVSWSWLNWPMLARFLMVLLVFYSFLYILSFFSFTWTSQQGVFIAGPETMLPYFLNQPNRWEVIRAVFQTHLGPPAWSMPGP